jgi:hypothetical protein
MLKRGSQIIPRQTIVAVVDDLELAGLMVFLIAEANHDHTVAPRGTRLKPGQLVTGKRALAARFQRTESWCYRGLKRLQERTLIELEANRDGTVVTICNWETYTRLPKRREPPPKRKRTAVEPSSDRQRTASDPPSRHKALGTSPSPPTPQRDGEGWEEELVEEVKGLGVTLARQAVTAALANGCALEDFRRHLGHYEAHHDLWGSPEGVLYDHLTKLRPGQPAAEGWASFDPAKERELRGRKLEAAKRQRARELIRDAEGSDEHGYLRGQAIHDIDTIGDKRSEEAIQWHMEQNVMNRPQWEPRLRLAATAARPSSSTPRSTTANQQGVTAAAAVARSAFGSGAA